MKCEVCGSLLTEIETFNSFYYRCDACGGNEEVLYQKVYDTLEDFILSEWEEITIEDFELYAGKFNNLEEYIEQAREDLGYTKEIRRKQSE